MRKKHASCTYRRLAVERLVLDTTSVGSHDLVEVLSHEFGKKLFFFFFLFVQGFLYSRLDVGPSQQWQLIMLPKHGVHMHPKIAYLSA